MKTAQKPLSRDQRSWMGSAAVHVLAFAAIWMAGRPRFIDLSMVDWALMGRGARASQADINIELQDEDVWRTPGRSRGHLKAQAKPKPVPEARPGAGTGGGGGDGSGYKSVAQVSRLPKPLSPLEPAFPEEARRAGVEGTVILQVDIDETGLVKQVAVIQSLGHGCDESSVEAVRAARFFPAAVGEQPVPVRVRIPFRFQDQ